MDQRSAKLNSCNWRRVCSSRPSKGRQMTETFGYFRALPFGWTDCSDTDAGAVALYTFEQIVEFVRTAMLAESAEWTGDYRGPVFRAFEDAALRMGMLAN